MLRKTLITGLALLSGLILVVIAGWYFRVALIMTTAAFLLNDEQVQLTALQGMAVSPGGATVEQLDVLLPASGLRLVIAGIKLDYNLMALWQTGTVESLDIAGIALTQTPATVPPQDDAPGLLISDVLLLARDFPVRSLMISDITIPGRPEPLALSVQQQPGALHIGMTSDALALLVTLSQPVATDPAQLQLALTTAEARFANLALTLAPLSEGYRLTGTGRVDVPDFSALLGTPLMELLALPLASMHLDMAVAGEIGAGLSGMPVSSIALSVTPGSSLALQPELLAPLVLTFHDGAAIQLATGATTALSGKGQLSARGSWQQQAFNATAAIKSADCQLGETKTCMLDVEGSADLAAFRLDGDAGGTTLSALRLVGSGTAAFDGSGMQVTLNPASQLSVGSIVSAAVTSGPVSLSTVSPLVLDKVNGEAGVTLAGAELTGMLEQLVVSGYTIGTRLTVRDIELAAGAAVTGMLAIATHGLIVTGPQAWLPEVDMDASLAFSPGQVTFTTPLIFRTATASAGIVASGLYDIASGRADATLAMPPLLLAGEGLSLSAYLGGWPWPFDVMTGRVEAGLQLQWQPAGESAAALTGVLTGALTDTAGFYDEIFFRDLDSELSASLDTSLALPIATPPLELTITAIDVGLPISNIAVNYHIDAETQTMNIASFHGELLGGTLSGQDVVYDFSSERNLLNLRFTGLRLDHMLTLAEYEGVEATGTVSGMLPIVITPNGVEVEGGTLFSEAPGGTIRYLGGATDGGGNLGLDLVNQALGNYRFETLQSSIDYRPDGELVLAMKMQGHNPDMNKDQRINLNLNLSDNIPALLESLQAGRAIEDFIQGQYDRQAAP